MAIANKAFTQAASGSADPSIASHTPDAAGNPRFAVVMVVELAGSDTVTGVTYGGTSMTEIPNSPHTKATGTGLSISGWFLGSSVPTGTVAVNVTAPGAVSRAVFCWTYTAAEDCTVNATDVGISSDSESNPRSTISLGGVTSAVMLGFGTGLLTVGITELSGWAADMDVDGGSESGHGYSYSTIASADVTTGWDQAADDTLGFAVAVREGGGTPILIPVDPAGTPY
jgi:hypothetical protein